MTQVDPRDVKSLAQLLLAHAIASNQNGIVVFFSSDPANIMANVNYLKKPSIDQAQVDGLNALLARTRVTTFLDSTFKNLNF
jgi:hypothetical protein